MKRWISVIFALLVLLSGCTGRMQPSDDRDDAPVKGPGLGHLPVPRDQGDWTVQGAEPEEVAKAFVLGGNEPCDCDEVGVTTESSGSEQATIKVRLNGLKDDSVKNIEYLVTVQRAGDRWRVESATYTTECRRGTSPDGYCS